MAKSLKILSLFGSLIGLVLLSANIGCSTKKNTFTSRSYHNLTAHYNAYFNGKEALNEAINEIQVKSKDDYSKVLPVFKYGTKEDAQSVYSLLDRAIEKGSKVIQRHSIYIKRVEYIKWIDDAYLMLAKSYFYKKDFDLAITTSNFIVERYKQNPIIYEASLWQARAYNQQGRYKSSEALLSSIESKIHRNKATVKAEKMFPLVFAEMYILKGEYSNAVEYLEKAYELNHNKKIRTRITFILAQIYQRIGEFNKASEYYRKNLNYNPAYEMAFADKINLAKCFDAGANNSRKLIKELNKMLRDDKNKEFRDQIYFALAEISLKKSDTTTAINYLKLSARSSVSNLNQKGISYLKLAEIYYSDADYKPAQIFYDSAVQFLPQDYPGYNTIESRKNTLTDLVNNIKIVELEDSLQRLGKMTLTERIECIDKIIAEIVAQEELKKQEELNKQAALNNQQQNQLQIQPGNQWYFTNPQMINFGSKEFAQKWGERELEDLWRLSNKVVMDFNFSNNQGQGNNNDTDSTLSDTNPKNRNTYLKLIPSTDEDYQKSDEKIAEALFNMGKIYKNGLKDNENSIYAFKTLLKRYPDNPHLLTSYYYLYKIYLEEEDTYNSNYYKQLILDNYPKSEYAKIISDPEYFKKISEIKNFEEYYYGIIYSYFTNNKFDDVIFKADSALNYFENPQILPKLYYLKAVSLGKLRGDSLMYPILEKIISDYPQSEVKPMAEILLALREKKDDQQNTLTSKKDIHKDTSDINITKPTSPYIYDPEGFHFYIAVFDAVLVKITEIKNLFSDHNSQMYGLSKLTVNSMFLNDSRQIVTINRFDNKEKSLDYLRSIDNNAEIMIKLAPANLTHFVISANNYTTFFRLKNEEQYMEFFNENYNN